MLKKDYAYRSDFVAKVFRQGREEGREEGREAERTANLRRLLAAKFGDVSAEIDARITGASYGELGRYLERVLTADSIARVFDDA